MNEKEIIKLLIESGLGAYQDQIRSLIFPSYQTHLQPDRDEDISLGTSKVGGAPDLPHKVAWPRWRSYDQSFIAQINLAEVPSPSPLPASGLLSFFYTIGAMYEDSEGFYSDPKTCQVIYTKPEEMDQLYRKAIPEKIAQEDIMRPNRISFSSTLCVPTPESAYLEKMGLGYGDCHNKEDFEVYWSDFYERFLERWQSDEYIHRLLGHPDQIQGDMQMQCEILNRGISWDKLKEPHVKQQVLDSALKWRLLLQIDSEEDKTGVMFGDVGRLYFWIHENDLSNGRFDRVICEMQCS